jgi:RNA polymerase sigma factor (sigma-70 family)
VTAERDDMELLRAWRNGDRIAGTDLFRRHFASVFLFFRNKLGDGIDDIVQQTFLGCVEAGDRLDDVRSFKAYLFGIARYQLLRRLASGVRRKHDDLLGLTVRELTGPSNVLAKHEEQRVLLEALRAIPLDLQIAVELFYWEQLSLLEIASVLEIPEGTVKSRLFRAKQLLRQQIENFATGDAVLRSTIQGLDDWARSLRDMLGERMP